jgi:hypothetical protein
MATSGWWDDFYFDDKSWTIRYLVASTGNYFVGKDVLLSPFAVGKADVSSGQINVMLTRKQVDASPSIDTDKPVSSQHETSYYDYYGYPYYWNGPYLWVPSTILSFQMLITKSLKNGARSEKNFICAALPK